MGSLKPLVAALVEAELMTLGVRRCASSPALFGALRGFLERLPSGEWVKVGA